MKLSFLGPLYAQKGPYACAYLDTSRDIDDPERAIELRWRHLKQELSAQGADMATTGALAHVVGADRDVPGRHGQAVFATRGRVALADELPQPPARDTARFTMVPDAMPLAVQHAPDIPYAVVVVRRIKGATEETPHVLDVDFQTGRWPMAQVAADEPTRRRVLSGEWRQQAAELAEELERLADDGLAEVIVVAGDAWARGVLTHHLPKRLQDRVTGVETDGQAPEPGRGVLEEQLGYLFQGRMAARDRALTERFLAQRARDERAVEGLTPAVEALQSGRAEALLVNHPVDLPGTLWVGVAPKHIGLSDAELHFRGVHSCWQEPTGAALIRAVVGTGAELVVVPREELPLRDGLGVVLRYAGPGI